MDLALEGHPTRFVPEARVNSTLPGRTDTALAQRKRWEHGHLQLVWKTAPRSLARAVRTRSLSLLTLALDLSVLPLSVLALGWLLAAGLSGLVWFLGAGRAPAVVSGLGALALLTAILAGFLRFAGPRATLGALLRVPGYVLWKIPLYLAYPFRRRNPLEEDGARLTANSPMGDSILTGAGLRALLLDDDHFALDFLRAVLTERYPQLEIEVRLRPDPTGEYDLYFIDDDFEGVRVAGKLARRIWAQRPQAVILAFSASLDEPTLIELPERRLQRRVRQEGPRGPAGDARGPGPGASPNWPPSASDRWPK